LQRRLSRAARHAQVLDETQVLFRLDPGAEVFPGKHQQFHISARVEDVGHFLADDQGGTAGFDLRGPINAADQGESRFRPELLEIGNGFFRLVAAQFADVALNEAVDDLVELFFFLVA
jgi:hypothetical protein